MKIQCMADYSRNTPGEIRLNISPVDQSVVANHVMSGDIMTLEFAERLRGETASDPDVWAEQKTLPETVSQALGMARGALAEALTIAIDTGSLEYADPSRFDLATFAIATIRQLDRHRESWLSEES